MGPLGAHSHPRTRKPFLTRGGRLVKDFVACLCDLRHLVPHLYRQHGGPGHQRPGTPSDPSATSPPPAWATRGLHAAGSASFATSRSPGCPHELLALSATQDERGHAGRGRRPLLPTGHPVPRALRGCARTADTCITPKKRDGHASKLRDTQSGARRRAESPASGRGRPADAPGPLGPSVRVSWFPLRDTAANWVVESPEGNSEAKVPSCPTE